jgi:Holliday junction DNA helicase RuvB
MNANPPIGTTVEKLKHDHALRPKKIDEFVGNKEVVDRVKIFVQAAKERKEPMGHLLLYGPPGLGKTSIAHIIKEEFGANILVTTGPLLAKTKELAALLCSLNEGDILFIDEIHRIPQNIEELLYPALEDFKIDLMVGDGMQSSAVSIDLPKFTLVGATTRFGDLSSPLRSRFQLIAKLHPYELEDLTQVVSFTAKKLGVELCGSMARLIAERARGTPRLAVNLLRWLRDYITVCNGGVWDQSGIQEGLKKIGIDEIGLNPDDRRYLEIIFDEHQGGPVGVSNLATSLGEKITTIEEVLEPHLITMGLLKRTQKGRELTVKGLAHIKKIKQGES